MVPHKSRAGVKQKHCLQTIFLTDWNRHAEHLLLLLGTPWRKSQVPLQKHLRLCKSVVTIKKNSSKPTYRGLADWFTSFKEASSIPGIIWPSSSELLTEINSGTTRHRPSAEGCLSVAPSFQGNRLHQDFENLGISFPPVPHPPYFSIKRKYQTKKATLWRKETGNPYPLITGHCLASQEGEDLPRVGQGQTMQL